MSEELKKPLDLDEFFGASQPILVKWQGKNHELLRIEALGPKQYARLRKLQGRAARMQGLTQDMSDTQAGELEEMFDEIIKILCSGFPVKEIDFSMKMKIVLYYMEQPQVKKALEVALSKQTGATSIPG